MYKLGVTETDDALLAVTATLTAQNDTLPEWCRRNAITYQKAWGVLNGSLRSNEAVKLKLAILQKIGVTEV